MMDDITQLNEGDKVQTDVMQTEFTVTETLDSVGVVNVEGPRGGEKSLVQNKNNPDYVSLMSGADKKGVVNDLDIL